ncbi:HEAT repeat domain-containing protein [Paenibacillus barcinonensis]|uniref:3-methyladenine DNA glycosylase AlkC n=1 Tax=Paenibacillus barcinonensis TaxID=198119 RepID=A0A2V4WG89_PAEBA|nr:HEAT repeat domain-containing protein [Paenibacillus barcinonensis]PYE50865.1 3-methyladenine DNA glycosylase AlkC [Paenibacillus barcinonensis]QKS57536.1 HEAT repeat domain-containing protein [Paenibacillus barcinonensis]
MNNHSDVTVPEDILRRKGARTAADIPAHIHRLLQSGTIESVNLTEWLSVNHVLLLEQITRELEVPVSTRDVTARLEQKDAQRIMKIIPEIGRQWLEYMERRPALENKQLLTLLAKHRSDSVRCWAAYIIGLNPELDVTDKLEQIRPFAADHHFGVREIAWMAVRESIRADLSAALQWLIPWSTDPDPMIRRFAIESTRPRGVWAKHIQPLKEDPAMALPLLSAVKSDPHPYVQDSVSNWLNDAGKTNPDWVRQVCADWIRQSDNKHTQRIVKRGQRSI